MFSFSSFVSFSISFRVITIGQDQQFKNFRIVTLYFVKAIDSINIRTNDKVRFVHTQSLLQFVLSFP